MLSLLVRAVQHSLELIMRAARQGRELGIAKLQQQHIKLFNVCLLKSVAAVVGAVSIVGAAGGKCDRREFLKH